MNKIKLLELYLEIDSIIIGERIKGGVYRPCQELIPSSTIEGAIKHYFGVEVPAVGIFEKGSYEFDEFVYSVRDRVFETSKLPIFTEYLKPKNGDKIKAKVYIPIKKAEEKGLNKEILESVEFQMGALKSRGFGWTKIVDVKEIESEIKQGFLNVKLFEDEAIDFGIEIISPIYGYLFKPKNFVCGVYKRALFPGSLVKAPDVLLKDREGTYYDE
ncbi:conserved protein of unknown function [Methanocaldococcus lauensis]|uniref:Uncharacterized protein n=1 Tax=Methanocaldococcus lauensis TaxID=2546128 RepID=A0A8D6PPC1_9EURY|nr:hypothetical protein [Methanocaldococcus lauensis]CAB3287438.1 conserved protein of unknown function [Methanocaldococcus lauensis]